MSRNDLHLADGRVLPRDLFHLSFARGGGPGGQHANKTETKVDLRLDLDGAIGVLGPDDVARVKATLVARLDQDGRLMVVCGEHRSQFQNVQAAYERMLRLLTTALRRRKARHATKPTRGSQRRRLDEKRHRGEIKRDRGRPRAD